MSDEQEADVNEEEETQTEEGLQEGNFISLDYTARTIEDEDLVDTTSEEVAEEEGIESEDREFGPRTIVLGAGHIFEDVEEDIYGKEAGDEGTVSVEQAFGEYDNEQVRTISADKIGEDDRYPGARVNVDGQQGYVETIIGGRARVDFNHPLAGEDLEYDYEIVEEVEDAEEKAKGLFSMYIDADLDMWIETDEVEEEVEDEDGETETETVEKETLYIEATPQLSMNQQWMFQKQQIAQDVIDRLDLDRVIVQETIDGAGAGMMGMGGMGGMGGADLEEALEDADIDEDELVEELEADDEAEEVEE
ncbi:peptidylprolyl isomerase [Haladaptatus sp. AB643]|uniref:FKBP-type peptidyl-prolyl cis-trans isomerase n=1 Tax=Haladaptatus sp. AB643 TaxID=2934174 RepID=UPI00209C0BC2|nr:peptidylprolyl isomerase [Haladaptatus sp. AB643]MCO8246063.1 peptidylprolyl isomerase [Haladaptatus sp. AB643]